MSNEEQKYEVKQIIQVDEELVENISGLIEAEAADNILVLLADLHPADIAEIINGLDLDEAKYLFNLLNTGMASEVVTEIDENLREKILQEIDTQKIATIVDELDTDDATDIVSELPDTIAQEVLDAIDKEDSAEVKQLLKYPEDSAGGIMTSDFVYVNETASIKEAIEEVRKNAEEFEHIYYIYVLRDNDELVGIASLKSLLLNPLDTNVTAIISKDLITVNPEMDQEEVAEIMEKYDLVSIPVINENNIMLGRITIDDVVDVIQEEASEDIQKIAGLSDEQESADSIFHISRIRLPWLIIALVMELVAAIVLSSYESFMREVIIATFFIPVVMAMGGSSGTQAGIVMVRGLGVKELWLKDSLRKLSKEFGVALLNGIACGLFLLIATYIFFPRDEVSLHFAILLSISLLVIIVFSTMVGASIPVLLRKFNTDPAIATGPFVTTTNDILGLLIYLSFITMFFVA